MKKSIVTILAPKFMLEFLLGLFIFFEVPLPKDCCTDGENSFSVLDELLFLVDANSLSRCVPPIDLLCLIFYCFMFFLILLCEFCPWILIPLDISIVSFIC